MKIYFEDYFVGKAPPLTLNTKCYVFSNYMIRKYSNDIILPKINNSFFNDGLSSSPRYVYENYTFKERITAEATLPKGKYILWNYDDMTRVYNPVEDDPDIFIKFAEIGAPGLGKNISDNRILRFVSKYGVLKTFEHRGFDIKYGFHYNLYPVTAFKKYSAEAFFIFRLYTLLNEAGKKREIRGHLLNIEEFISEGFKFFQEIVDYKLYLFKWWEKLSDPLKNELIEYFPHDRACDANSAEVTILEHDNLKYDARKIPSIPTLGFADISFWKQLFTSAPIEAVIDAAREIIASVTSLRIEDGIIFSTTMETEEQGCYFKQHWTATSLLSIMWFLFYLEITGQMTQRYKICKHCSKPIYPKKGEDKVHGKTIFHEGCRQKHHQHLEKQVKAMHNDGKSVSEICLSFPTTGKKTIEKWINEAKDS